MRGAVVQCRTERSADAARTSDTVSRMLSSRSPTFSPTLAGTSDGTRAFTVVPSRRFSVTICVVPRYSVPKTAARSGASAER